MRGRCDGGRIGECGAFCIIYPGIFHAHTLTTRPDQEVGHAPPAPCQELAIALGDDSLNTGSRGLS